ncbi:MAG: hypothetical protein AAFR93_17095 [Pseudomonadota bacterium]
MPTVMVEEVEEMVDAAGLYAQDTFEFASHDRFANHQTSYDEAQDRLGNFEIQDLMSRFNQAQTLASSVGVMAETGPQSTAEIDQDVRNDSGEAHLDDLAVSLVPSVFAVDPMF